MRIIPTCLFAVTAILAACHGGGSDSDSSSSGSPAPTAANNGSFLLTGKDDTINGIPVPPPPADADNTTPGGVDSNKNGVRDDVERLIATAYGGNTQAYAGAMTVAKRVQSLIAPASMDQATAQSLVSAGTEEARCLASAYFSGDFVAAAHANQVVIGATLNTPDRIQLYRDRLGLTPSVIDVDFQKACS